jgi:hypothetical protein
MGQVYINFSFDAVFLFDAVDALESCEDWGPVGPLKQGEEFLSTLLDKF